MDREAQQRRQLQSDDPTASRPVAANGHSVKVPMAYEPMEVELEAPEPPPHNASADLHWAEEHLAPLQPAGSAEAASGRTGLGIMRVSSTPRQSKLREFHANNMPALKPRPQKGDKQWPPVAHISAPAAAAVAPISYSAVLKKSNPLLSAAVQAAIDSGSADASLPYADDLPPERFAGNIEYKWKLIAKSADRLVHLTTQLAYRLSEGGGECLYELGVQDDGFAQGLAAHELDQSIQCVLGMARSLGAEATVIQRAWGREGVVAEVRVRRVGEVGVGLPAADRLANGNGLEARSNAHDRMAKQSAATVLSPPSSGGALSSPSSSSGGSGAAPSSSPNSQSTSCPCVSSGSSALYPSSCDLRLALVGGSSGGKSSLLGVLVSNQRDDGRGRARLHVVRHRHEVERGRSSAIARQVLGFDARGQIINYTLHHTQTLGSAAVAPPAAAASFLGSPGSGPVLSPSLLGGASDAPPAGKKKDKGISALFGGGDSSSDDDDDDESDSDGDDGSICDFGFECAPEPALAPLGLGDAAAPGFGALPAECEGGLDGASSVGAACSSSDWQRITDRSHKVYTIFDIPASLISRLVGTTCPDYCCIVVSCTSDNHPAESATVAPQTQTQAQSQDAADAAAAAVVPSGAALAIPPPPAALITALTREQIMVCAALHIPFLLLACKADLADTLRRERIVAELQALCAQVVSSVPDGGSWSGSGSGSGPSSPPPGARVIRHKIPVLLSPVGTDLTPGEAAEAQARLDACMDLLERNQTGGLSEEDVPAVLRGEIVRAAAAAAAAAPVSAVSSGDEKTSPTPLWFPQHTFAPLLLLSNVTGEGMALFKRCLFRLHNYRREYWDSRIRRAVSATAPAITAASELASASDLATAVTPAPAPAAAAVATASTGWEAVGAEFSIDEIFTVDSVGSVVSGTILAGVIHEGDTLLLGPLPDAALASSSASASASASGTGTVALPLLPAAWSSLGCPGCFRPVVVKSLHLSRKSYKNARAGQSATLALRKVDRAWLRRGMVLLAVPRGAMHLGVGAGAGVGVPRAMPTLPQPQSLPLPPPERGAWPRCCVGFEAFIRLLDPASSSSDAPGRTLREAQTGGGSASGSSLSRRRAQAAQVSSGATGIVAGVGVTAVAGSSSGSSGSGGRSSPLSSPGCHAITLRGQPIIHVGSVRQGGEVVSLRPVALRQPSSFARVQNWVDGLRAQVASRDVDQPIPREQGLAALLDALEREEAQAEADAAAAAAQDPAHTTVSLHAAPAPSPAPQPSYALVRFEFLYQAEYLRLGRSVLFRDDRARGTGLITDLCFVDDEEENPTTVAVALAAAQPAPEAAGTGSAGPLPARKRSPPQHLREREQSDSKTPSPSNGSGRKRISSPPLQSPSPPVPLSAFARSKERRALARKAEAAAAAAVAAGSSVASLPHSQSHWTLPQAHSQSQRASICGGVGVTASPLVGPRAHPAVSLGCTPLLSATPWPAPALTDELQLNSNSSDDAQPVAVHVDARE